jgi:hypothetical protein
MQALTPGAVLTAAENLLLAGRSTPHPAATAEPS